MLMFFFEKLVQDIRCLMTSDMRNTVENDEAYFIKPAGVIVDIQCIFILVIIQPMI